MKSESPVQRWLPVTFATACLAWGLGRVKPTLLRMRLHIVQMVLLALNSKVEAPGAGHAGLPEADGLVVLFRSQRRMAEVFEKEDALLVESFPHFHGCIGILL